MKMQQTIAAGCVAAALLGAGGWGLYQLGLQHGNHPSPSAPQAAPAAAADPSTWSAAQGEEAARRHIREGIRAGSIDPATGRKVLYYQDPMAPGTKFDAPGKSPFMDMMLVPVYAGASGADSSGVTVSPRIQQNLGLRTAVVGEGRIAPQVIASGTIAWNEHEHVVVQVRANAFVQHVHVRTPLERVRKGQPLAQLYVPDWIAAQEDFLALGRMQGSGLDAVRDAAKARMRQAGMSDAQIAAVEAGGRVQATITLAAPISGVLTEVGAHEGMSAMPGTTLFRINSLASVWAQAEVPESQAALLKPGTRVKVTTAAWPGETFDGTVQALLPEVTAATRTVKARMEIANPGGRLVPGMFVRMQFTDGDAKPTLLVPTEAVIQTGTRTVVMIAEDGGGFRPAEVQTGLESEGRTQILRGLQAGQKVVVSSQFLIDSEASLRGLEARLNAAPAAEMSYRTTAKIESLDKDTAMLTHPEIPALKWPGMTMEFRLPAASQRPPGLAAGDSVDIEFRPQQSGEAQILSIRKAAPGAKP